MQGVEQTIREAWSRWPKESVSSTTSWLGRHSVWQGVQEGIPFSSSQCTYIHMHDNMVIGSLAVVAWSVPSDL